MDLRTRFLRKLGGEVYGAIVPLPEKNWGAEHYLEDLWQDAPAFVALANTAAALILWVLPPFILGKFLFFPALSQDDKEKLLSKLTGHRWYILRGLSSALRMSALVASLRSKDARYSILGPEPDGH